MHGLQEPEASLLHGFDVLFLLVARFLVLLLQAFDEGLEVRLQLCELRLLLLDGLFAAAGAHGLKLLDLRLLRIVAKVQVSRPALRPQAVGELLQGVEITAALVVLKVVRIPVLDGRVSAHAHLVAQGLAPRGTVHVRDQRRLMALVRSDKLVPIGLHALAMATPRGKELDEHGLARHGPVPSLLRELRRCRKLGKGRHRQRGPNKACHRCEARRIGTKTSRIGVAGLQS
mmetsp:Transcript_91921/g.264469  ORF Transcript_91921/g.264469 Transcript_91921/m.264469 type:complete len:230 (-) Transcript_91921:3-692(-)